MKNNALVHSPKPSKLQLVLSCLKIAFLSFGGGMAVMGLIKSEFVDNHKFIPEDNFKKILILANILPGPTIIQMLTFIGYYSHSLAGGIIAFSSIVFPGPLVLVVLLSILYNIVPTEILLSFSKGIFPAVMAILFAFNIELFLSDRKLNYNWLAYFLIFLISLLFLFLKINTALLFMGLIITLIFIKFKE
ncbi:Chromate transporter [Candidatus Hepatincolaceae symbiont of Richtersius coronifer]